jgi:hypothetical protein
MIPMDVHAQGAARTEHPVALGAGVGHVQVLAFNMLAQVILGLDNFLTEGALPQHRSVVRNHSAHARHDCVLI